MWTANRVDTVLMALDTHPKSIHEQNVSGYVRGSIEFALSAGGIEASKSI